jgi:hypothetical protein
VSQPYSYLDFDQDPGQQSLGTEDGDVLAAIISVFNCSLQLKNSASTLIFVEICEESTD